MGVDRSRILNELIKAITQLDVDKSARVAEKALKAKIPAYDIVTKGLVVGMDKIGEKYEEGEFFLSELVMAGVVAKAVMDVIGPSFQVQRGEKIGKLLIGTVEGDLHDIGKNLVVTFAEVSGFEVCDLGVDVSTEVFVEKVKGVKPDVVGMSSLLSITVPKIRETIEAFEQAGVRSWVKIIIGGRAVTQAIADEYGADAYAEDPVKGVKKMRAWCER